MKAKDVYSKKTREPIAAAMAPFSDRVQRIIRFCESLTVPDGDLVGEKVVLRDWQKAIINAVYGPRTESGKRKVRQALLTMARKNGKTSLIAMLLLVHLCGPEAVRNGELYSVAFDKKQAAQVFKYAADMIYASETLSRRLNVKESYKIITDPVSGSIYEALSNESKGKHGKSSSFIIFDELAQFGTNRSMYEVMMTSRGAHSASLVWVISTQAENDLAVMSELVDYGRKVNAGEIADPTFAAFIYEVHPDLDAWDEDNWHLANPALGDFKDIDTIRDGANKAKLMPSGERPWRNLELNQRVSSQPSFVPHAVWIESGAPPDPEVFYGADVTAGLDLSAKNDLSALVFAAMDQERYWHIMCRFWTPGDNIRERSDRDRVPYDVWAKEGHLEAVPGRTIDYEYIARAIAELHAEYHFVSLRFDRWMIEYLLRELRKLGVEAWIEGKDDPIDGGLRLIPHGQGFKDFSPAVERVEDLVLENRLRHGNHPVLSMCAANTRIAFDPSGNRKFDKIKSTGRIDGMVAMAMALNWTKEAEEDGGDMSSFLASEPFYVELA